MQRVVIAIMLLSLGCSEKGTQPEPERPELNVSPHERKGVSWEPDAPFTMDTRWRFLSGEETVHGYEVKGAWEITLKNTSKNRWSCKVWSLSFVDKQGFQIEEFSLIGPLIEISFEGNETFLRNGNFYLTLGSLETANEITKMEVWASFEKL